ncbi:hypothetical protein HHI36_005414 [Cryptolaemus montrouzieri]|uniref:Uncharacterized protein n=1 Tax=Cryptolaemus montrouzieri TaxID=559131 RepID=A0ABD2NU95_9CUCU
MEFFRSRPRKCTADGVGGYLNRTADEKMATGSDICDASTFYHTLHGSTLSNFIPSISNVEDRKLIDKGNIHPSKTPEGVHGLVKVSSVKNIHYTYLGVTKSEVHEGGEVKIMFYKTVDDTGRRFKQVETDISYEPYDNILEIVPNPNIIEKGKRIYFDFDEPLNVFEK